jgi:hypothetical protein
MLSRACVEANMGLAHTLLVFDDGQRSSSCAILGLGVVHEVRFADFEM